MIGSGDHWREIEPPKDDNLLNVRRADVGHPLDYWIGRDVRGRYILRLDVSACAPANSALPRFAEIDVVALRVDGSRCSLVLTLLDSEQFEIFRALCSDLMRATVQLSASSNAEALANTLSRLRRWQSLLEQARKNLLSHSKIVGLVGELLVLRDLLLPRLDAFDAVKSWRGPYGDDQDFLLAGSIIEVKSQLSTSDKYLHVSSEMQLDSKSHRILVCHQTLDVPSLEENGAVSLNGLVSSLMEATASKDHGAADLLQSALLEAGYQRCEEYGRPYWLLSGRFYYEVREGFPRIVRNMIDVGIDRVRYRIALNACDDFELGEDAALEFALNE